MKHFGRPASSSARRQTTLPGAQTIIPEMFENILDILKWFLCQWVGEGPAVRSKH